MFQSAEQIRTAAINRILSVRTDMSVLAGEPQVDIIDAMSIETAKLWFFADYLQKLNSVMGMLSIIEDETYKQSLAEALGVSYLSLTVATILGVPSDLENDIEAIFYYDLNRMAGDYGVTRKAAERATGIERFYVDGPAPVTIRMGSRCRTAGNAPTVFSTTLSISAVSPTFDSAANAYYVDVPIQAEEYGTGGNVSPNTILVQSPAISRVTRVTNLAATSGGSERESNADLLARIQAARFSTSIATRQGYRAWAMSQEGVDDAFVTGAGDTLMTRASAWGVDVWILGENQASQTFSVKIGGAGETYVLPYQPVLDVVVTGYTEDQGYDLIEDETGGYANSVRAYTQIAWREPPEGPATNQIVNITVTYDQKVRDLQEILDTDPVYNVPANDVLVKRGLRYYVLTEMRVTGLPGYPQSVVESVVESAIIAALTDKKFGEGQDYSDLLVIAAEATSGGVRVVDRIDGFLMGRNAEFHPDPWPTLADDNLAAEDNEYLVVGFVKFLG